MDDNACLAPLDDHFAQRSGNHGTPLALAACLAPLVAAMSLGFTSPALDTMKGKVDGPGLPPDLVVFGHGASDSAAWFSALINIGALCGAVCGGLACQSFGLRGTIQFSSLMFGVGWTGIAASSSPMMLCTMRVFVGLGVGLQSVATPAFIAVVAPPHLRGVLGTMNAAGVLSGVVVVDTVGGIVFRVGADGKFCAWRRLAFFISACAVLLLLLTLVLPEPRKPDARRFRTIGHCGHPSDTQDWPEKTWKLVLAGLIPMLWQQLSGISAIIFYGQSILDSAGVQDYNMLGVSVIAVQLAGIALAVALIERVGRRVLLLISVAGMTVGAAALGVSLSVAHAWPMAVVGSLYAYVLSFAVGLGPVPWLLLPELGLPQHCRVRLASLATASNWACSFVVTGPPLEALEARCGLSAVFFTFSAHCLCGTFLIVAFVPETRVRH